MNSEEKELLIKDLSTRLPYGVKVRVLGWDKKTEEEVYVPLRVYSINTDGYVYFESNDYDVNYCSIDSCKPYLRPMSSMTDTEFVYFMELRGRNLSKQDIEFMRKEVFSSPNSVAIVTRADNYLKKVDWLNENHFDYRCVYAEEEGKYKTMIQLGLALEAPEDMYNNKSEDYGK